MGYPLNVIIDDDLLRVLQGEADRRGLSLSAVGREAIMEKYAEALKKIREQRRGKNRSNNHQQRRNL